MQDLWIRLSWIRLSWRQPIAILLCWICIATSGCSTLSRQTEEPEQSNPAQLVALARLAERQGDKANARSIYKTLIEKQQSLTTAHHRLGVLSAQAGDFDAAEQHFFQAREAGLDSVELDADEAYVKMLVGDLLAAERSCEAVLKNAPTHKRTLNNLAILRAKQGRFNEAMQCLQSAVDPAQAHANVGYLLTQFGELSMARDNFHRALELDPELTIAAHALLQLQNVPEPEVVAGNEPQDELAQEDRTPDRALALETPDETRPAQDELLEQDQLLEKDELLESQRSQLLARLQGRR